MSISPSPIVQINALQYDPDIDGQTDLLPDIQPSMALHTACTAEVSSHAENIEEDTVPVTANSEEHSASLQDTDRLEPQSQPVLDNTDHSVYQDTEQPREEYPNNYRPQLEDIPEFEDDEENSEEGQFADMDFIDHHTTTEESDQIHHKHISRRLQTRNTALRIIECQGSNTISLNQNIIILTPNQNNIKGTKIQMYTSLPTIHRRFMVMAWMRLW